MQLTKSKFTRIRIYRFKFSHHSRGSLRFKCSFKINFLHFLLAILRGREYKRPRIVERGTRWFKRRDDRFSLLLEQPHCWSLRLDRCEFKAFHAICPTSANLHTGYVSTHWTVNRVTYSPIRRHAIIHRDTCFFFFFFYLPIPLPRISFRSNRVDNLSIHTVYPIDRSKYNYSSTIRMLFQRFLVIDNWKRWSMNWETARDLPLIIIFTDWEKSTTI